MSAIQQAASLNRDAPGDAGDRQPSRHSDEK
jgi:hypothetical protein